jgi:hypothetical protein
MSIQLNNNELNKVYLYLENQRLKINLSNVVNVSNLLVRDLVKLVLKKFQINSNEINYGLFEFSNGVEKLCNEKDEIIKFEKLFIKQSRQLDVSNRYVIRKKNFVENHYQSQILTRKQLFKIDLYFRRNNRSLKTSSNGSAVKNTRQVVKDIAAKNKSRSSLSIKRQVVQHYQVKVMKKIKIGNNEIVASKMQSFELKYIESQS